MAARLCIFKNLESRLTAGKTRRMLLAGLLLMAVWIMACANAQASDFSIEGVPAPPTDQQSYLAYLTMTGQPVASRIHGYPASYDAYRDYRMLVYGHPSQVSGNRYSAETGQYAILGFSYDEFKVTNTLFPDDAPGGVSKSKPFSWVELDQGARAASSWSRLNEAQKRYLKQVPLTYRNNGFGLMNFDNLGLNESNTVVLAPPSWHLGSALYTEHYLPGVSYKDLRYATFYCSGNGNVDLSCRIEIRTPPDKDGLYTFPAHAEKLTIAYRATGRIEAYHGLARSEDIIRRGVGTQDGSTAGSGDGPFVFDGTLTIDRSVLDGLEVGQTQIAARTYVISAMGDIISQDAHLSVPIRARKPIAPLNLSADLRGSIAFFSGSRQITGRTPASSPHRFLGLETVWLTVRFSKPVHQWEYRFLGDTFVFAGEPDRLEYQVPIRMPLTHSSLSWLDRRIRPPHRLEIAATDQEDPDSTVQQVIDPIELTGDIFDLLYLQLAD